ncbi:glycosyltransferase-like protein [Paenibacillus larvae subsp. larvae]|uniref:Glycosyltransferase-like protein n=1 Tax=Paenibacillus larvae subsp. larvae TaxID=147375 RepID=A0A2L1UJX0_9BACL|nr:glycosyltransferase [Paenibacillus larvae]AQT84950.1 hypothetical protein B1222_12025 [Paenibacillus larvae subsp. pulvifaciens]AQZ46953.1 hypothetical protein B5S25_10460 [Paenibacillus larvae subsp. pulvifaciens]AVF28727.1 glycosyltransferase-like protein [Paenibacillus larvae subsp. larvae]AVF33233.1 glycosyltransferase-like protein [Paenibacillus larvae subsp. larvae]MBH0343016.1 hypothetical protein [Paenibacillus larvae]
MDYRISKPKVSIIIPVYNNAPFLEQSIRSAICQTYANIEIVMVDDCSTDPAVQPILDKFSAYPNVRLYRNNQNQGISRTQNIAIFHATGDIIAFLDCDDLLEPFAVELSLVHWTEETKYSFSNRIHIDEHSCEIKRVGCEHNPLHDLFTEQLDANMYASHFKMISRDVFRIIGVFNPDYDSAQDYDLVLRAAFRYPRTAFVHVPYYLYKYRIHSKQTTHLIMQQQIKLAGRISHDAKMRRNIRNGHFHIPIQFVIVTHKNGKAALKCIRSIEKTVHVPYGILLFENGSPTRCTTYIRRRIRNRPGVKAIFSRNRISPASALREALRFVRKDAYIIRLDPDLKATEGWIEELLVRAEASEDIGAVSCRIASKSVIHFTGGLEKRSGLTVKFDLCHKGANPEDLSAMEFRDIDWNPGDATLYKRWFTVPDGYHDVYHDMALSYGLRKNGKRLVNAPGSLLIRRGKPAETEENLSASNVKPGLLLRSAAQFFIDHQLIIDDPPMYALNRFNSQHMSEQDLATTLHMAYFTYS